MKFHSPEVALYIYKSIICSCMEYCCHVWAGATSCYLELLDKLQKQLSRTVGPSLAASLELLAHCWDVASLSLFCRYYSGSCSGSTGSTSFFSWEVYVNSFFSCTARLWNFLPTECFPLTYDLSGFKFRINRHLLTLGSL